MNWNQVVTLNWNWVVNITGIRTISGSNSKHNTSFANYKTFINFKWYRFYIVLKDGTEFSKKVPLHKKPENVSALEKVYAKYLQSNIITIEST